MTGRITASLLLCARDGGDTHATQQKHVKENREGNPAPEFRVPRISEEKSNETKLDFLTSLAPRHQLMAIPDSARARFDGVDVRGPMLFRRSILLICSWSYGAVALRERREGVCVLPQDRSFHQVWNLLHPPCRGFRISLVRSG